VIFSVAASGETKIRVGHFPNITRAQGVIARALSRNGKGWFEQQLGADTKIAPGRLEGLPTVIAKNMKDARE
jgi:hypothetical protein